MSAQALSGPPDRVSGALKGKGLIWPGPGVERCRVASRGLGELEQQGSNSIEVAAQFGLDGVDGALGSAGR